MVRLGEGSEVIIAPKDRKRGANKKDLEPEAAEEPAVKPPVWTCSP